MEFVAPHIFHIHPLISSLSNLFFFGFSRHLQGFATSIQLLYLGYYICVFYMIMLGNAKHHVYFLIVFQKLQANEHQSYFHQSNDSRYHALLSLLLFWSRISVFPLLRFCCIFSTYSLPKCSYIGVGSRSISLKLSRKFLTLSAVLSG